RVCGVLALVVLAVALLGLPAPVARAQEELVPFAGKFLCIDRGGFGEDINDLEQVELRKYGGRTFLVGVGADLPSNRKKGVTIWVAMDSITEITAFPTLDQLKKHAATRFDVEEADEAPSPPAASAPKTTK